MLSGVSFFAVALLLKPRSKIMACPEIVECQTKPACSQDNDGGDKLTNKADRLLEDVEYTPNTADNTC